MRRSRKPLCSFRAPGVRIPPSPLRKAKNGYQGPGLGGRVFASAGVVPVKSCKSRSRYDDDFFDFVFLARLLQSPQ